MGREIRISQVKSGLGEVSYLESGEGKPVIFLPGWPMGSWMYMRAMEATPDIFLKCHHLMAVDYPGWERSTTLGGEYCYGSLVSWLVDFLDAQQIERADLVGVSFGAAVAIMAAAKNPERIDRMVVQSPPIWYEPYLNTSQKLLLLASERIPGAKQAIHGLMVQGSNIIWKSLIGAEPNLNDEFQRIVFEQIKSADLNALYMTLLQIVRTDMRGDLAFVKSPTLVMTGSHDYMFDDARSAYIGIAGSQFKVLEGGHGLPAEYPYNFALAVTEFLT